MTEFLFYLLVAGTAGLLVHGLVKRGGYTEYPFLAAAVYAGWFLPQAASLQSDASLPKLGLAVVLGMALLCLVAIVLGWRRGVAYRPALARADIRGDRLIWPAAAITAFAALMRLLIELQPAEARAVGQWTGTLAILAFFGQIGVVSLSLSILLFLKRMNAASIALLGCYLALFTPAVLIFFRRSEIGELFLAAAAGLFFARRIVIPRMFVVGALVLGFFVVHAVGQLRDLGGGYKFDQSGQITTRLPTLEEIAEIDFLGSAPLAEGNAAYEMRNSIYYISAIENHGDLTLGAELWNRLVFSYVPAQIFGVEFKQSLMMGGFSLTDLALMEAGYSTNTGTTSTGFTHAYRDFWFFGAFVFFATSYVLGRAYSLAGRGSLLAQTLYMSTIMLSLLAITHYSYYYFVNIPLVLAALLFIKLRARKSPRTSPRGRIAWPPASSTTSFAGKNKSQ